MINMHHFLGGQQPGAPVAATGGDLSRFRRVCVLRRGHPEGEGAAALVRRSAHRSVPRCDCFGDVLLLLLLLLLRLARPRLASAGCLLWRQRGTATERSSRASYTPLAKL